MICKMQDDIFSTCSWKHMQAPVKTCCKCFFKHMMKYEIMVSWQLAFYQLSLEVFRFEREVVHFESS